MEMSISEKSRIRNLIKGMLGEETNIEMADADEYVSLYLKS